MRPSSSRTFSDRGCAPCSCSAECGRRIGRSRNALTRSVPEQLAGIEGVAIDMWDAFENSIREHVPDADTKIVYDNSAS
ncbi:MAG: transposase [Planctomycetes bacterium]|nr:transposase [Planctomycetota bacterium]